MFVRIPSPPLGRDLAAVLSEIPGVTVRRGCAYASPDVAPLVAELTDGRVESPRAARPRTFDPSGVRGWNRLFPWQQRAALALASGSKSHLWHPTGGGKTATGLAALALRGVTRAVVVTRAIGRDSWVRDAAWCGDFEVLVLHGEKDTDAARAVARRANKRLDDLRAKGARCSVVSSISFSPTTPTIVVVGWDTLAARLDELQAVDAEALVLDEAHCGKGRTAARANAALALAWDVGERKEPVWTMTATPVRDRLSDLWAQLAAVDRRAWGQSSWKFVHRYSHAVPNPHGGLDTSGPHVHGCARCEATTCELKARLAYWVDRVEREELAAKLPPLTLETLRVPFVLGLRRSGIYAPADEPDGIEHRIALAAAQTTPVAIERAAEVLLQGGKTVLVGNRRRWAERVSAMLVDALPANRREGVWVRAATGELEAGARAALAREYMERPGRACLVGTIDAMGESIDLQDTDAVYVCALPYAPGQAIQLIGRFARPGQRRPCALTWLVAEATIAEEIERLVLGKLDAARLACATTADAFAHRSDEEVIAGLKAWLGGNKEGGTDQ